MRGPFEIPSLLRFSLFLTIAIAVIPAACADGDVLVQPEEAPVPALGTQIQVSADPTAVCSPLTSVPLEADGGRLLAGSVEVGNDEENVYVTFHASGGWTLKETHVFVGTSSEAIPVNKAGNPIPGHFPYASDHREGNPSFSYAIPLNGAQFGETTVVAAHADIMMGDRIEGAWGGGSEGQAITDQGSWGTYFQHPLMECASGLVTPRDGGTVEIAGAVSLQVPPGAVSEEVQITIAPASAEDLGPSDAPATQSEAPATEEASLIGQAVDQSDVTPIPGTFYDLGPDGLEFNDGFFPTLTITYDPDAVSAAGFLESELGLFVVNGIFQPLNSTVEEEANKLSGPIPHFTHAFAGGVHGADLIPASATFTETSTDVLSHEIVVQNVGTASADLTNVAVFTWFSDDQTLDTATDDVSCGLQFSGGTLAPGESTTGTFNCNVTGQSGAYLLYQVDRNDRVAESDETNNFLALEYGGG